MSDSGFPSDPGDPGSPPAPPAPPPAEPPPTAPPPEFPPAPPVPPAAAPEAAPVALAPAPPAGLAPVRTSWAGFWIRFLALIIDWIVLYLIGLVTHSVVRLSGGVPLAPVWRPGSAPNLGIGCAEGLIDFVVSWLYQASLESSEIQGTMGKWMLGLRVTDLSGRRISFGRATGRTFAKILSALTLFVGFAMAGFTQRKQALHDFVAETVVLKVMR